MRNFLVPLTGCPNDTAALAAADTLALRFEGQIEALHVYPDPAHIASRAAFGQFTTLLGNVELIRALQKQAEDRCALAAGAFEEFERARVSSAPGTLPKAVLVQREGNPVAEIIQAARLHDLVVLARPTESEGLSSNQVASILVLAEDLCF